MHPDTYAARFRPSSPLSPRSSAVHASLPSQPPRHRPAPMHQPSRPLRLDLPSYSAYTSRGQSASPSSAMQSPAIVLNRGTQPTPMDSPRLMREKQKELIARAQLTSKLAASPMASRPDAPRLDPLGSPKGPVTPLALEEFEAADYFAGTGPGRFSPVASPSARSSRSSTASAKDEKTIKKKHKMELYQ